MLIATIVVLLIGVLLAYAEQTPTREHQILVVASVLIHEAGNQGPEGITAVAKTIQQRMIAHKARWGYTAYEIVSKRWQFSCMPKAGKDENIRFVEERSSQWSLAYGLAEHLVDALQILSRKSP